MNRQQNDKIGRIAGAFLIGCAIAVGLAGLAMIQSQDAIDEARLQQQAIACYQHTRMCVGAQDVKK